MLLINLLTCLSALLWRMSRLNCCWIDMFQLCSCVRELCSVATEVLPYWCIVETAVLRWLAQWATGCRLQVTLVQVFVGLHHFTFKWMSCVGVPVDRSLRLTVPGGSEWAGCPLLSSVGVLCLRVCKLLPLVWPVAALVIYVGCRLSGDSPVAGANAPLSR